MTTSTFVSNIWHLPVPPGIHSGRFVFVSVHMWLCAYDRGESKTCLVSREQRVRCPGGLMLWCKLTPQPQASATGSVDSSADEFCPYGVGHWSSASQPLCRALVCSQTTDCPPYKDRVCSSSCVHWLGCEYCIEFTEECLNTGSKCVCSSKEGKRGCLTSAVNACRDHTWHRLYYKVREQTSKEPCDGAATACPEAAGKTPKKERRKRSETCTWHSTLWSETSLSAAGALQDAMGLWRGSGLPGRGYKLWHPPLAIIHFTLPFLMMGP